MKSQKGITLIVFLIIIVIILVAVFLTSKYLHMEADKMEAEYKARFHTVSFDTDGGEYISPIKVEYTFYASDKIAKKDGYIFIGWLLDGQPIGESIRITQDITLKASYRKKVDNTYNSSSSNNNKPSTNQSNNTNNYNNSNNTKPSNNNSNIQTQPENKKTYNINVRKSQKNSSGDEACALTVMNYQTESSNSKVAQIKDGEEWIIVNMKFENKSDSTIVIDKNDFKIIDGAGRYNYSPSYHHLDTELDMIEIRAGQTSTFSVRFLYYKNNEMVLRFYHPSTVRDIYTEIKLR